MPHGLYHLDFPMISFWISFMKFLMWIFRTRQEIDTDALGTTDIRVIRQEERRLEDIYQKEIESFINHLR